MNLVKKLEDEMQRGNTLMLGNGDIVSPEKIGKKLEKDYLKDVQAGRIDMRELPYTEYEKRRLGENVKVEDLLTLLGCVDLEDYINMAVDDTRGEMDESDARDYEPADTESAEQEPEEQEEPEEVTSAEESAEEEPAEEEPAEEEAAEEPEPKKRFSIF